MKELVETGKALGILSFDDKKPVGWCSFARLNDHSRAGNTVRLSQT
jgi:hypothetical protein